jgi:hypothetical protein
MFINNAAIPLGDDSTNFVFIAVQGWPRLGVLLMTLPVYSKPIVTKY